VQFPPSAPSQRPTPSRLTPRPHIHAAVEAAATCSFGVHAAPLPSYGKHFTSCTCECCEVIYLGGDTCKGRQGSGSANFDTSGFGSALGLLSFHPFDEETNDDSFAQGRTATRVRQRIVARAGQGLACVHGVLGKDVSDFLDLCERRRAGLD
jgi:hypothetical protein